MRCSRDGASIAVKGLEWILELLKGKESCVYRRLSKRKLHVLTLRFGNVKRPAALTRSGPLAVGRLCKPQLVSVLQEQRFPHCWKPTTVRNGSPNSRPPPAVFVYYQNSFCWTTSFLSDASILNRKSQSVKTLFFQIMHVRSPKNNKLQPIVCVHD